MNNWQLHVVWQTECLVNSLFILHPSIQSSSQSFFERTLGGSFKERPVGWDGGGGTCCEGNQPPMLMITIWPRISEEEGNLQAKLLNSEYYEEIAPRWAMPWFGEWIRTREQRPFFFLLRKASVFSERLALNTKYLCVSPNHLVLPNCDWGANTSVTKSPRIRGTRT